MENFEKAKDFEKYYNENSFWKTIAYISKKAGLKLIYLSFLLYYTLNSNNTTKTDRAIIVAALGYFIFPLDIIPDYIPFIGYTDDLSILLFAYRRIKANLNDDIRNKAKTKLSSFFGKYDTGEINEY